MANLELSDEERVTIREFAMSYDGSQRDTIRVKWNGERGDEFEEPNLQFRGRVLVWSLENLAEIADELVRDLYLAEAEIAKISWGIDGRFPRLAREILRRGPAFLDDYFSGLYRSVDTLVAGSVAVPTEIGDELLEEMDRKIKACEDESANAQLELRRDHLASLVTIIQSSLPTREITLRLPSLNP